METCPIPDRTLLYQARALIEAKIRTGPLDQELVELTQNLYRSIGAWEEEIVLLRCYLRQGELETTTQALARWHIVDCLALLEQDAEAAAEQEALFQWAISVYLT
jgi:hypothetical protein